MSVHLAVSLTFKTSEKGTYICFDFLNFKREWVSKEGRSKHRGSLEVRQIGNEMEFFG